MRKKLLGRDIAIMFSFRASYIGLENDCMPPATLSNPTNFFYQTQFLGANRSTAGVRWGNTHRPHTIPELYSVTESRLYLQFQQHCLIYIR